MKSNWRHHTILFGFLLIFIGLIWRVYDLMIVERNFLLGQGNARSLRIVNIPAYRGMITDRNGSPLAISTPVISVWLDPQDFETEPAQLHALANLVQVPENIISNLVQHSQKKEFVYLARGLDPYLSQYIRQLAIPGVYIQQEFRRFYPEGEVTSQLLGFTNIDDKGQEGLELQYNDWLQGTPGKKRVLKDRYGREVANLDLIKPAQSGHNLVLSIDRQIQYIAYTELKKAVELNKAQSGSAVVLDIKTGEVLAMVNQPSANPNAKMNIQQGGFRNRTVTDVFEPGSTMKAFSVANALMFGHYKPDTIIDTRPGYYYIGSKRVRDDANYGVLTVTGVLQKSSNIGVSKMTLTLPPDSLWQLLHRIGFGDKTNIGFPGESSGVLIHHKPWRPFILATMSFGYGLSVTNLQLAQAYSILASGGIKKPITLLKQDESPAGTRVLPTNIANTVIDMMQSVVEKGGTATSANIPGYNVSGKTGTAQIAGPGGYQKNHHVAIFAGLAPLSNPRLIVTVEIKDPRGPHGEYFGGQVSAPVFAKIMGAALRALAVPPDNLTDKQPLTFNTGLKNDEKTQ